MPALIITILLVGGGILLASGINSIESVHDDLSRVVISHYSNRTVSLIVSGAVCFLLGLVGLFGMHRGRRA